MAVDKGFANENPENLNKFVGDYVFNPKDGKGAIPIGVPSEVLEIGTGFMMIRRKTFEMLNEKHPELMYRPDHVRTEHFDGSREIMMYFQADVDRPSAEVALDRIRDAGDDVSKVQEIVAVYDEERKKATNRYLSEDYWFCQKVNKAGLKTWICPWMQMTHVGSYVFGGSVADIAQLGAAATADPSQLAHFKKKKGEGAAPPVPIREAKSPTAKSVRKPRRRRRA